MDNAVSQSRFFMWRTLFAVAHADNIVTDEEITFMASVLEDVAFTDGQNAILKDDLVNPKNVEEMFKSITNKEDRIEFFDFARDLVWVDGDFGSEEQGVMIRLLESHVKETNVDDLVGNVSLEFEQEPAQTPNINSAPPKKRCSLTDMIMSFRSRFS